MSDVGWWVPLHLIHCRAGLGWAGLELLGWVGLGWVGVMIGVHELRVDLHDILV